MLELSHPGIGFLRRPLDPRDVVRGERMCAAAGTGYNSTSVLCPWRVLKRPPPPPARAWPTVFVGSPRAKPGK